MRRVHLSTSCKSLLTRTVAVAAAGALLIGNMADASAQTRGFGGTRGGNFGSVGSAVPTGPTGGGMRGGSDFGGRSGLGMRGPGPGFYTGLAVGIGGGTARQSQVYADDEPVYVIRSGKKTSRKNSDDNPSLARRGSGMPQANERRYVPDEVVIGLKGNPPERAVTGVARRFKLTRLEQLRLNLTNTTLYRWHIPDRRSVPTVIRELEADRAIASAQPNYLYALQQDHVDAAPEPVSVDAMREATTKTPAVDDRSQQEPQVQAAQQSYGDPAQYALGKLHLPEAHGLAKGDKVFVAVIDSGIDTTHPDLAGAIADQFDALDSKEGPHAHGTGIAGVIAAHGKLMGAAPSVHILAVRAFGAAKASAEGTTFNIVKGLDWALGRGARVVNMSFAGPADPAMQSALAAARDKGAVLIAAAGNAGPKSPPLYPAANPSVIAVTATDGDDKIFDRANRGAYVALAAPGVDIIVPSPGEAYQLSSGTSFSAAFVSGIAALVLERKPGLGVDAVKKALLSSAKDLGPKGRDDQFGEGLADAYQAVSAAGPATVAGAAAR